ncbi:MAG TPA: 16S rRNA (cytosine(967)-C(5))-methyltransferase RsmB [Candidatus Acidoferrum sp.]|nr:16S rRNA (cytosine(967)-C(5))-methyltransferase RsmB [Candidatus Acidoferrum sp.]
MAISPARKTAFDILLRVESEGAYVTDLLHEALGPGVRREDAALTTEISLGVLRRRALLDFLLERQLKKPVARLDFPVLTALRMGLYQLRYLDKIPARAAVNESVELVKRARKSSAAPLVNAVLRRTVAETSLPAETLIPANLPPAEQLAILHSHPEWMIERWLDQFGDAQTIQTLEADNLPPRLSAVVHHASSRDKVFSALAKAGLRIEDGALLRDAFSVNGGSPSHTTAFREGLFSIQDEASQAVPLLLGARPGDRVLDLCAAPGGKTAPLVRASGTSGLVVAADRHTHRLRAMDAHFRRIRLAPVSLIELDAARPLPFGALFHRILVDAPCSGTGTLARHPEIRWRLSVENIRALRALQIAILLAAVRQLAAGGRLVYSTCSLEREENENVVEAALARSPGLRLASRETVVSELQPHLVSGVSAESLIDSSGFFRTLPGEQPCDGFFAAVLDK